MKKLFSFLLCVTCAFALSAQTPDGLTCETAIRVDSTYTGSIPAPGAYYFTAWTYDLPLTCYFYPETEGEAIVSMEVDFSCTPGVYDDPNIQELLDATLGWGIAMPLYFGDFSLAVDPESGKKFYKISVPEFYREQMAKFGITYNVQAFVKLTTNMSGVVSLTPDFEFKNCVENSEWLKIPDTISTGLSKNDDVYVWPVSDWQNDSVRLEWKGTLSPLQVWISDQCDFDLTFEGEKFAREVIEIQPGDGWVLTCQKMKDWMSSIGNGGIYYVRFVSIEESSVFISKQPIQGPMADAVRLEVNESVKVDANDVEQVYYFPIEWKKRNIQFVSSVHTPVKAYFATDVVFEANDAESKLIVIKDFVEHDANMQLSLSEKELTALCDAVLGGFVFVKLVANKSTTITPMYWDACYCDKNSNEIYTEDYVAIPSRNTSPVWRIYHDDWKKYDVNLYWEGKGNLKMYLLDTCSGTLATSEGSTVLYHQFTVKSGKTDTLTITSDQWKSWADRVSEDGYLYFRFNANSVGNLSVTSTLVDIPVLPSSPCVEASLLINSGDQLTLNLDSAFTIYRIEYAAWKDKGISLSWTGTTDLHTFVAETCTFAVAPYNKYVHVYVPVQGENTLDAAAMAELAAYVDEDGFLYIRFLTENEGVLTVK